MLSLREAGGMAMNVCDLGRNLDKIAFALKSLDHHDEFPAKEPKQVVSNGLYSAEIIAEISEDGVTDFLLAI
jgi:hypothetical protein